MPTAGKTVFKYLKENGESTLGAIVIGTNLPESEVKLALEESVKSNHILFDNKSGKYKVLRFLNPPLTEEEKHKTVAWDYTKIKENLAGAGILPRSSAIPRQWRNPYLSSLPDRIDQGERGTCVGFSAAIGATLIYYQITRDLPSPAEVAAEKRNVEYDLGCPNNKPFLCDEFNVRWKSPQYIYTMSRIVGNVTDPEGSYVSDAAKSLNTYGSVFETDCKTAKTPYCVTSWYPTLKDESTDDAKARIMLLGNGHLTEGYAQVTSFDDLCEAVYTHGFALIPINIYSNYTNNGYAGNYPDPNGDVVGSHAQCIVGYDLDARTLEFRQSWGTAWTNEGGISEKYFTEGAGAAFVILDEHETVIAHQLYTRVSLVPNVPCTYKVDDGKITATDNVVVLEHGVQHTIVATPVNPAAVVQSSLSVTTTPVADAISISFEFTPVAAPPDVKKSLIAAIIDLITSIWNAIFKKK